MWTQTRLLRSPAWKESFWWFMAWVYSWERELAELQKMSYMVRSTSSKLVATDFLFFAISVSEDDSIKKFRFSPVIDGKIPGFLRRRLYLEGRSKMLTITVEFRFHGEKPIDIYILLILYPSNSSFFLLLFYCEKYKKAFIYILNILTN